MVRRAPTRAHAHTIHTRKYIHGHTEEREKVPCTDLEKGRWEEGESALYVIVCPYVYMCVRVCVPGLRASTRRKR